MKKEGYSELYEKHGERIICQLLFHQGAQTIIGLAHVGRFGIQPDAHLGFGKEHGISRLVLGADRSHYPDPARSASAL